MNHRMVLYTICIILRIEAVLMVPALIIALVNNEANMVFGFVAAMVILLLVSLLSLLFKPKEKVFY
ncbi:TrkH family potassium uptake protein, partial [Christensenellaceae bacterium OttesenSCG-928-K19]|nr:TrkH family potassium uptake protein [Christensenellaceae bacterium OttesenSCG-928-K19]